MLDPEIARLAELIMMPIFALAGRFVNSETAKGLLIIFYLRRLTVDVIVVV